MEISVGLFFAQYKVVLSAMTLLIVGKVRSVSLLVRRKCLVSVEVSSYVPS